MKKTTLVFVELGMLGGIVVAGYMLPDNTRLSTFISASVACLAIGNLILFSKVAHKRAFDQARHQSRAWIRIIRALAILAVGWLLVVLLFKR